MIDIRSVTKRFGAFTAVSDVSLHVARGELLALLGPSGSGKTTLLRILAGLEAPDLGTVECDGEDLTLVDPADRKVGFVFQHYALFGHMSVFENVAFGLRVMPKRTRPTEADITARVMRLLELVRIAPLKDRRPSEVSGGQRQRVALARALAIEPKILLLDEPFGALDAQVRKELRRWLRTLHDELHVTSVFVTHDQEEALAVADRVAVLTGGELAQIGRPDEVYARPANARVYEFLGEANAIAGRARLGRVEAAWCSLPAEISAAEGAAVVAYVRPEDVEVARTRDEGAVEMRIRDVHPSPRGARVTLARPGDADGELVVAEIGRERREALALHAGDVVYVQLRGARAFPA
jgi:sulfate/thiosulfate transport system ATP-binding protein